jgi:hypothetical protein
MVMQTSSSELWVYYCDPLRQNNEQVSKKSTSPVKKSESCKLPVEFEPKTGGGFFEPFCSFVHR